MAAELVVSRLKASHDITLIGPMLLDAAREVGGAEAPA
jgi:hypothetical protein